MQKIVGATVAELGRRKTNADADGAPVDILNLFCSLSIDAVTLYLFGVSFSGLNNKVKLTPTPFCRQFRRWHAAFFYLPDEWVFKHVGHWVARFDKGKMHIVTSTVIVKEFATGLSIGA